MGRWGTPLVVVLLGCGNVSSQGADSGSDGPDGQVDAAPADAGPGIEVAHVPEAGEYVGTDDLTIAGATVIDTEQLTIGGVPADIDVHAQEGGGPDIAVLHVRAFDVLTDGNIDVVGSRPLVIIAGGAASIAGRINASSDFAVSVGGGSDRTGPGAGANGLAGGGGGTGGGGGGGFSVPGGDGGDDDDGSGGGTAGTAHGDPGLSVLRGGGWGGAGACAAQLTPGGAGGGSVHIFSTESITISGFVTANGGGGRGGVQCDPGGGGGGGAGGAIYLHAPTVSITGVVTANGGSGGGGSSNFLGDGFDGENGQESTVAAVGGRNGQGGSFGMGGSGGALNDPTDGLLGDATPGGGGGGGAAGRIVVVSAAASLGGTISPAPVEP